MKNLVNMNIVIFFVLILFKNCFCSPVSEFIAKIINEHNEITNNSVLLCFVGFKSQSLLDLHGNITSNIKEIPHIIYHNEMVAPKDHNSTAWKCTMTIVALKDSKKVVLLCKNKDENIIFGNFLESSVSK